MIKTFCRLKEGQKTFEIDFCLKMCPLYNATTVYEKELNTLRDFIPIKT